ncbi:hypothetical protein DB30_03599 [Enhygromyxa salina]|uniref:Uncharacterized protein n=1 Tax=Enhygromyxa salina TaxID=215803 RepID=A0A0C2DAV5_9BACT|nr:hypothetical protein [Enhygromyxa salina]KIG17002.1 hypothetical protein DB30_03599 [Enhygromyxa salina]
MNQAGPAGPAFAWFGWLGIALLVLGQLLTLVHLRPVSDWWYAICWSGFTLAGDAWVLRRSGRSLLRERPRDLVLMAVVSAATWWALEIVNHWMQVWSYSPSPDIPVWRQQLRSTVFFATLIPATWVCGMLALALWPRRGGMPPARAQPQVNAVARGLCMLAGVGALIVAALRPELALAASLLGVLLVLDPLNFTLGRPSLLACVARRDLRVPLAFALGTMLMGVVGEMWNYPADPKWTYDVPWIGFAYVFEMPALGFLGYGMLALTIFAAYQFVRGFVLPPAAAPGDEADPLTLTGL